MGSSAIHQSINQSNRRLQVTQSANQSIAHYWFLLIVLIKQSSNQLISPATFQVYPINQSIDHHLKISFLPELSRSSDSDSFVHRFGWGDAGEGVNRAWGGRLGISIRMEKFSNRATVFLYYWWQFFLNSFCGQVVDCSFYCRRNSWRLAEMWRFSSTTCQNCGKRRRSTSWWTGWRSRKRGSKMTRQCWPRSRSLWRMCWSGHGWREPTAERLFWRWTTRQSRRMCVRFTSAARRRDSCAPWRITAWLV